MADPNNGTVHVMEEEMRAAEQGVFEAKSRAAPANKARKAAPVDKSRKAKPVKKAAKPKKSAK